MGQKRELRLKVVLHYGRKMDCGRQHTKNDIGAREISLENVF